MEPSWRRPGALRRAVCIAALVLGPALEAGAVPFLIELGPGPGGDTSWANGISGDGSTVVGYGGVLQGSRWVDGEWSGVPAPSPLHTTLPYDASYDGTVVVGLAEIDEYPFRWTVADGPENLGSLGYSWGFGTAYAVDHSGDVVVGRSQAPGGYEAFLWTPDDGMVSLGTLAGGTRSEAHAVSGDGSVVAGWGDSSNTTSHGSEAFVWISGASMLGLGDLPGGEFFSTAYGISADGSTVVGNSRSSAGPEAFRWTLAEGIVGLGDLLGGRFASFAWAASEDGSRIVGYGISDEGKEAFLWDAAWGSMVELDALLESRGLDLTGWTLTEARAISDDGMYVAGIGINPDGDTRGFVAFLPEPAAPALLGVALLGLAAWRGGSRAAHWRSGLGHP